MTAYKPPRSGSLSQNEWLEQIALMGGQFWPPESQEEDMPEVGAKYPMMLYDGARECIVYDDEEREEAKANGFKEHASMVTPDNKPPKPPEEIKPAAHMPPPIPKAPSTPVAKQPEEREVKTTVSVQKTVEVKPKAPTPSTKK